VTILLLSGAVAVLLGAIFNQLLEGTPRDPFPIGYYILATATEVLKIAGSTVIITGLISIVIDAGHWRTYFEDRIREIVIKQDFLKVLDPDALRGLHTEVLRAQFRNAEIGGPDSLLSHYQTQLQEYISAPYREGVAAHIDIRRRGDEWLVTETVDFTCCKNAGVMQKTVSWAADSSQVLMRAKITATTLPDYNDILLFQYESAAEVGRSKLDELQEGISLEQFQDHDRVRITLEIMYSLRYFRVISWWMIYPTHRFSINVQAEDHRIDPELFMPRPKEVRITGGRNNMQLNYDGWLLPRTGLVVRLFPDQEKAQ
jgi:hypothetical protein